MTDERENGSGVVDRVERDAAGRLVVHPAGGREPVVGASVARCLPWTLPDDYISLLDADGHEIALLRSLEELDDASRRVVDEELRDKVFNPRIRRIRQFKHEFGVTSIRAETDRGEVTFQLRSRDDIRILSPTRALFRDADGNTYELPDLDALDADSRKFLSRYF